MNPSTNYGHHLVSTFLESPNNASVPQLRVIYAANDELNDRRYYSEWAWRQHSNEPYDASVRDELLRGLTHGEHITVNDLTQRVHQRLRDFPTLDELQRTLNSDPFHVLPESMKMSLRRAWRAGNARRRSQPSVLDASRSPPLRAIERSSSLRSAERQNTIDFCTSKFKTSTSHVGIKRFINKLIRVCDVVNKPTRCSLIANAIRDKFTNQDTTRVYHLVMSEGKSGHIDQLFEIYIRHPSVFNKAKLNTFRVRASNAVDTGGVGRHYMQVAFNQLAHWGIFTETEEGTQVYKFNQGYQGRDKVQKSAFAGAFVAFMICCQIKAEFHFSKSILAPLVMKPEEYDDDYSAMIYMYEVPTHGRSLVNLMNTPADIEHALQDVATLKDGTPVNADNFRKYVHETAKENFLTGANDMLSHFVKSFYITRAFLRQKNVSIAQMDALITGTEIGKEERQLIADKIGKCLHMGELNPAKQHANDIIRWLIYIIHTGKDFPKDEIKDAPHLPQDFPTFMKMLCFFWTSSAFFNDNFAYRVIVHNGENFVAHTCSQQLDIPSRLGSRDELFRQLIRSVPSTEFGFA